MTTALDQPRDFKEIRDRINDWRRRFPMFNHDVKRIERIVENHIQEYSTALVYYRQTKQKKYLEQAQNHIDEIDRVINTVEKVQLIALLARR
jgi:Skp family chaperone for outer membrane proteins